jgi:hypothetical protein
MSLADLLAQSFKASRPSTPLCQLEAYSLAGAPRPPDQVGGIPWEHIVRIGEVSKTRGAILIRDVNPTASPLILRGYATKPLSQKGKSADWGPHAGFIPANAYYAKGVKDRTDAVQGNTDLDHALEAKAEQVDPETEPPVRLEGRVAVNISVPLVLGEWRILEVLREYIPSSPLPAGLDALSGLVDGKLRIRPIVLKSGVGRPTIGYQLSGSWPPPSAFPLAPDSIAEPKRNSTFYLIVVDEVAAFINRLSTDVPANALKASIARQADWVRVNELGRRAAGSPDRLFAIFVCPSGLIELPPDDPRTMKGTNGELSWFKPDFLNTLAYGESPSTTRAPTPPGSSRPSSARVVRPSTPLPPVAPIVQPMRVLARPGSWDARTPTAGIPYTADYDLFAVCPSLPVAPATGPAPANPLSGGLDPEEGKLLLASIAYLSASWMRGATLTGPSKELWATHKKMIDAILGEDAARQFRRALSLTHTGKVLDQSLYGSFPNSVRDAAMAINGVTGVGGGQRTFKVVHHGAEQHNLQVTQPVTGKVVAVVPTPLPDIGAVAGGGPYVYFTKDATELSKLIRALRKAGYYYKQNLIHLVSSREEVQFDPFRFGAKLDAERARMTNGTEEEKTEWARIEATWAELQNIVRTYETTVRGSTSDRGCLSYLVDQIGAKDAEFKKQARNIIEGIEFCALISEQPVLQVPTATRSSSGKFATKLRGAVTGLREPGDRPAT